MRRYVTSLFFCFLTTALCAQESSVATQLSVGGCNFLDSYLSPEKYRGVEWRFVSDVRRDSRKYFRETEHRGLSYALSHEASFAYPHNRVENGKTYAGYYDFFYGVMYRWNILDSRLSLLVGGMIDSNIGFAYNNHNSSNNPAQGYFSTDLGALFSVSYAACFLNKSITFGYEVRIPMLGVMFSPNYEQSYYEIFNRGNYDNNIVLRGVTTFQMRQCFTIDMRVKQNLSLRLGYLSDIRQSKPNNLRQHHYYNSVVVGVVMHK